MERAANWSVGVIVTCIFNIGMHASATKSLTICSLIFILNLLINTVFLLISALGALKGGTYYREALKRVRRLFFKKR